MYTEESHLNKMSHILYLTCFLNLFGVEQIILHISSNKCLKVLQFPKEV